VTIVGVTSPAPPTTVETACAPPTLYRSPSQRLLGGVARGLAAHLGVETQVLRIAFVVMTLANGLGLLIYAAFWVFVPLGKAVPKTTPAAGRARHRALAVIAMLIGAAMLIQWRSGGGTSDPSNSVWPFIIAGAGVALLWRQADDAQRHKWLGISSRSRKAGYARGAFGGALVAVGLAAFTTYSGKGLGDTFAVLRGSLFTLVGLLLIFGPYLVRLTRDLGSERRARIRAQERAEVAAHVHDSVLHTLTLIQRHVDDPREVAKLARAQERELRMWLYRPQEVQPDITFAVALRAEAAEVEDMHGVSIEIVCVGDCPGDEKLAALIAAAREAMVNAAKYAGDSPISVFAEVTEHCVELFVRDQGPGFDLDAVPEDRLGVRESVLGRMRRNGGKATIHTAPGEGTEIEFEMERAKA
jgi:signal transduction histidine kinase